MAMTREQRLERERERDRTRRATPEFRAKRRERQAANSTKIAERSRRYYKTPKGWSIFARSSAKKRAAKRDIPFAITADDILAAIPPDYCCPVFGTPFQFGGGYSPNSPSLDRIRPALGYVPGNIAVISYRANMVKNDADYDEIILLAAWLHKVTT